MRARSTACALPATSRPRAKVSFEPGRLEVELVEDPPQRDDVEVLVGDLDSDRALARDRRLDPQRAGSERHRQVVRQRLDPADLDVRRRLDLVLGHHRARVAADDLGRDAEPGQLLLDDLLVMAMDRLFPCAVHGQREVIEDRRVREAVLGLARRCRVAGLGDVVERAHRTRRGCHGGRTGGTGRGERGRGRRRAGDGDRDTGRRIAAPAPDAGLALGRPARDCSRPSSALSGGRRAGGPDRGSAVRRRRRLAFHARRRHAAQPAGGAGEGPRQLGGTEGERDHEADHDQAHEQDECAWPGNKRDQELLEEPSDSPAAALDPEELDAEDLEAAEETDERDRQTDDGGTPTGVRLPAGTPFEIPAGTEQQEREQPAAGLEPGRDRIAVPVRELALAWQQQRNERHRTEQEERDADDRAGNLGADRGQAHGRQPAAAASSARGRLPAGRGPPSGRHPQTSTTTGKTIGRRFVCSYR